MKTMIVFCIMLGMVLGIVLIIVFACFALEGKLDDQELEHEREERGDE